MRPCNGLATKARRSARRMRLSRGRGKDTKALPRHAMRPRIFPSPLARGKNLKHTAPRQPARDQLVRGEVGDDLAAVLGDDDFLLDAGGAGAVLGAFPGLE